MNSLKKRVGQNITRLRKACRRPDGRCWSQSDLATQAGLTLGTIQKIESGASWPDWKSVEKLARALGAAPEEILRMPQPPSLMEALEVVNRELNIDLRPVTRKPLNFDGQSFLKNLSEEIQEVRSAGQQKRLDDLEELLAKIKQIVN